MKGRIINSFLLSLLLVVTPVSAGAQNNLLLPGDYHAEEVSAKTGQRWLALFSKPGGAVLSERTLKVAAVKDFVSPDRMGKRVSSNGNEAPLFLVRGIAGLSAGPIQGSNIRKSQQLTPNGTTKIVFGGRDHPLEIMTWKSKSSLSKATSGDGDYFDSQEISLSNGKTRQVLNRVSGVNLPTDSSYGPVLLWAGDLDRDGKLDLLINTSYYDNESMWTLFLSNGAAAGQLVRKVATFTTIGC